VLEIFGSPILQVIPIWRIDDGDDNNDNDDKKICFLFRVEQLLWGKNNHIFHS